MGNQPAKERVVSVGSLTVRTARSKPRINKDGRQQGSNIFTEHSGKISFLFRYLILQFDISKGPVTWNR